MSRSRTLAGMPASDGVAVGRAHIFRRSAPPARRRVDPADIDAELRRLQRAVASARAELHELRKRLGKSSSDRAEIFRVHTLMLEDPELVGRAWTLIVEDACDAAWAVERAGSAVAEAIAELPDEYLRTRADDVRDVVDRVLRAMDSSRRSSLAALEEPAVVVARELFPSDTVEMDRARVLGLVIEQGSATSHAAILARTGGIPAVVGVRDLLQAVSEGDFLIVDGDAGTVVVNPTAEELSAARATRERTLRRRALDRTAAVVPAVTSDGQRVTLAANISSPAHVDEALAYGAEGIGLLRTEFLFLDRHEPPSEDEQFEVYRGVLEGMGGRPVIIRTLDAGGDKPVAWLDSAPEANPFLGLRGLRLSLKREDLFLVQLRALLRAAEYGDLWVMFPMVSGVQEIRAAKRLLQKACDELARYPGEGGGVGRERLRVGAMIEVPSAALLSEAVLAEVDFASIGSNDLIQYTLAADRSNAAVAGLADAAHPAVLRLISEVVSAARRAGRPVGICGDMAGDPVMAPLLIGLGVRELSMAPSRLPVVKRAIKSVSTGDAERLAQDAQSCVVPQEVRHLLRRAPASVE